LADRHGRDLCFNYTAITHINMICLYPLSLVSVGQSLKIAVSPVVRMALYCCGDLAGHSFLASHDGLSSILSPSTRSFLDSRIVRYHCHSLQQPDHGPLNIAKLCDIAPCHPRNHFNRSLVFVGCNEVACCVCVAGMHSSGIATEGEREREREREV
jgi:hypothetical protein